MESQAWLLSWPVVLVLGAALVVSTYFLGITLSYGKKTTSPFWLLNAESRWSAVLVLGLLVVLTFAYALVHDKGLAVMGIWVMEGSFANFMLTLQGPRDWTEKLLLNHRHRLMGAALSVYLLSLTTGTWAVISNLA